MILHETLGTFYLRRIKTKNKKRYWYISQNPRSLKYAPAGRVINDYWIHTCTSIIDRFRTAVPFWGQTSQIISNLSPKRDCSPKRVKEQHSSSFYIYCCCIWNARRHRQRTQCPSCLFFPPDNRWNSFFSLLSPTLLLTGRVENQTGDHTE